MEVYLILTLVFLAGICGAWRVVTLERKVLALKCENEVLQWERDSLMELVPEDRRPKNMGEALAELEGDDPLATRPYDPILNDS